MSHILYPILMSCCRSDANQKKMRKTVYSTYEEKKLYIHEEGVGNKGGGTRGVQAAETV